MMKKVCKMMKKKEVEMPKPAFKPDLRPIFILVGVVAYFTVFCTFLGG